MDEDEHTRFQRARHRHAKRLASEAFSRREALTRKGPSDDELQIIETQRVTKLIAGRRQREARLVADFVSNKVYNLSDEEVHSMEESRRMSRHRVKALLKGRRPANSITPLVDELIRALQTYLTSCVVYVGFTRPGQNAADITGRSATNDVTSMVRRNQETKGLSRPPLGHVGADASEREVPSAEEHCAHTRTSRAKLQASTPDTVFTCFNAQKAIVTGTTMAEDEVAATPSSQLGEVVSSSDTSVCRAQPLLKYRSTNLVFERIADKLGYIAASSAGRGGQRRNSGTRDQVRGTSHEVADSCINEIALHSAPYHPARSRGTFVYVNAGSGAPHVCVPLAGMGASSCIGVVGAQGFKRNPDARDDAWYRWLSKRMDSLVYDGNRAVRSLRLVRARGLPTVGTLEVVPTGTGAKVVYGHVHKIGRKRGALVYGVRWEDGLVQLDIPKRYMRDILMEDDESAGKYPRLSADVVEHLAWIGDSVGPVLAMARKNVHLNALKQVTLAGDARHRHVLETALRSLLESLPAIAAAEVWQADSNGVIRCTHGQMAGGEYCMPNVIINSLLHQEDVDLFCLAVRVESRGTHETLRGDQAADGETRQKKRCVRGGPTLRFPRTPGVLAAPFQDHGCKVGRTWIGMDKLARGLALVLRMDAPSFSTSALDGRARTTRGTHRGQLSSLRGEYSCFRGSSSREFDVSEEDGLFAASVAKEVGIALACVRGRAQRAALRALAVKRIAETCLKPKPSGKEAMEVALAEISKVLPESRAYVGILQPGGESIIYRSATANSNMLARELHRGEGVSFACLDDPEGRVRVVKYQEPPTWRALGPPQSPSVVSAADISERRLRNIVAGSVVDVWYASKWFRARAIRDRGHQCFDVHYDDFNETEAGVPNWRLRPVVPLEHLDVKVLWNGRSDERNKFELDDHNSPSVNDADVSTSNGTGSWPWPFICVPLRHENNRIGVLGVDGWTRDESGRVEERHPATPVVSFLQEVGTFLSCAIHTERRNMGLSTLKAAVGSKDATADSALEALIVLLRETITFRTSIDVLEARPADPGKFYLRAEWQGSPRRINESYRTTKERQAPVRVFDRATSSRVDALCATPAQLKKLNASEKGRHPLTVDGLPPFEREVQKFARDGLQGIGGLQAAALASKPESIVGRVQRFALRPGGGRPYVEGCYVVLVSRAFPYNVSKAHRQPQRSVAKKGYRKSQEDGDVTFLSEMCQALERGFMEIVTREQRAIVRTKAFERVRGLCTGFAVRSATSAQANPSGTMAAPKATSGRNDRKPPGHCPSFGVDHNTSTEVQQQETTAATSVLEPEEKDELVFTAPARPAFPAETSDGRRGALVALKDGRLAVLVHQGHKRVAVLDLPGGKQQTFTEAEVKSGQSIFLQSGEEAVLVETIDGPNAVLVIDAGGKVSVTRETTTGKSKKIPLRALKHFDGITALAAGTAPRPSAENMDLAQEVIAAVQWVFPQVDVYVGILAPFASSLHFPAASSRSAMLGHRLFRHTKPNGGSISVVSVCDDDDSSTRDEAQSPSWDVIDMCETRVIPGTFSEDCSRFHFFADSLQQGWPWIAVPIRPGRRSHAVRGILCVDSFEEPWAGEEAIKFHPEDDVRTFLEACASSLGLALDREAKASALHELRTMAVMHPTALAHGGKAGRATKAGLLSSVEDIHAAIVTAVSKVLVNCDRVEVWEITQPRDDEGVFFGEPLFAGRPPAFRAQDGDTRESLRLQITHCAGLDSTVHRCELSDLFCTLDWSEDGESRRTPTARRTMRPVWRSSYFDLPLVEANRAGGEHLMNANTCESGKGSLDVVAEDFPNSTPCGQDVVLERQIQVTVNLWDESDGNAGSLGHLILGAEELLRMATSRSNRELPLVATSARSSSRSRTERVVGSIGLRVSAASDGAIPILQRSRDATMIFLEVMVHESSGLTGSDGAHVYVSGTFDGRDVGTTPAMPNGDDPVWMEPFFLELPREHRRELSDDKPADSNASRGFVLTVWDRRDSLLQLRPAEHIFLGRLSFLLPQLEAFAGEKVPNADGGQDPHIQELPLEDHNGQNSGGSLTFSVEEMSASAWRAKRTQKVTVGHTGGSATGPSTASQEAVFKRKIRLTILRAEGLAQADDSGSADPMCILRLLGQEVGRTSTVYGSLDPVWGSERRQGESFLLSIPRPRDASTGRGDLVVEVFDEDFGNPNEFLGQVKISGNELLRFRSPGTFKGVDAQNICTTLQKKAEMSPSAQWLVQGTLCYKLEGVDSGDETVDDTSIADVSPHSSAESPLPDATRKHPRNSQYRRLEVRVMEARGLAKADRFRLSDPYVIIRANELTELGRTRTVRSSLDPLWTDPEERFVIAVGRDCEAKCDLAIEVWDDDELGQGDFLGQVAIPKAEILDLCLPTGRMECELEHKKGKGGDFNRLVQGSLALSIREAYSSMPDDHPKGSTDGQVLVAVLSAKGLAKTDVFGKSDPFVVILLNGREIGRTRTLFKTLNPVWTEPEEEFTIHVVGSKHRCNVVMQVWDDNFGKQGDFFGQVTLNWVHMHLLPGEGSRHLNLELDLRDGISAREQGLVQGTIHLRVRTPVLEPRVGDIEARSYVVTVDRAWGLAKTNHFSKADTFVSVKVNGESGEAERGRTGVVTGTLHPKWREPAEVFIVTGVEELILEVWNADYANRGVFLGEARLSKDELAKEVAADGKHEFSISLRPKRAVSDDFNRFVQGSLRLTCQDWMNPMRFVSERLGEFSKLTVVSAARLPRRQFDLCSPLARVRWNGLEVGRTRTLHNYTSPAWDESFQISLPRDGRTNPVEVLIEVLDASLGEAASVPTTTAASSTALLGFVRLKEDDFRVTSTDPPCKVLELPLELLAYEGSKNRHMGFELAHGSIRPTLTLYFERTSGDEKKSMTSPSSPTAANPEPEGVPFNPKSGWPRSIVERPTPSQEQRVLQLKVLRGNGLASIAGTLDAFVSLRACGRDFGITRVSAIGRTTCPEWVDEGFILPEDMCAELWLEVWGRKLGDEDTFLGRATLRCTVADIKQMSRRVILKELPLQSVSPKILRNGKDLQICGSISFSLGKWRHYDHAAEVARSDATRGLQVQVRVTSASNLPAPASSVFATFTLRGTEVSKTTVVAASPESFGETCPTSKAWDRSWGRAQMADTGVGGASACSKATFLEATDGTSHVWPATPESACTITLPEDSSERRQVEIEIDLWEEGMLGRDRGEHLGQVLLSGDFVPYVAHGSVASYPLRPRRLRGSADSPAARGALRLQLWLQRGGECLASEYACSAVVVETLEAKGLQHDKARRKAFCVVKEDGKEIGRTRLSDVKTSASMLQAGTPEIVTDTVSWITLDPRFTITPSLEEQGSLSTNMVLEVWETATRARDAYTCQPGSDVDGDGHEERNVGSVTLGSDVLLHNPPGRVSIPLVNAMSTRLRPGVPTMHGARSPTPCDAPSGAHGAPASQAEIILRVTPQVGLHWGRRAIESARLAKSFEIEREQGPPNQKCNSKLAHVVYMTNAEGSARSWRVPVTPGDHVSQGAFNDIIALSCASVPACCPSTPSLVVAPFSDVGISLGDAWVGPHVHTRCAIVAHRSRQMQGHIRMDTHSKAHHEPREGPLEDELYMRAVAAQTEALLRKFRASEMRAEQRRRALRKVQEVCDTWRRINVKTSRANAVTKHEGEHGSNPETGDVEGLGERTETGAVGTENHTARRAHSELYRAFLAALEIALPGVAIYLGLVVDGGRTIRYVACSRTSSMAGKELRRGEGVSFECVGPHFAPCLIYPHAGDPRCSRPGRYRHSKYAPVRSGTGDARGVHTETMADSATSADDADTESLLAKALRRSSKTEKAAAPAPARSEEESAVHVQRVFRGKRCRDRLLCRNAVGGDGRSPIPALRAGQRHRTATNSTRLIPKVFDYGGRVGWPFVCVPLEAFLGASSIGVMGLDNFDEMGSGCGTTQPEPGVVELVADAGRALGKAICSDLQRRATDGVTRSAKCFESSLVDVLFSMAKAAQDTVVFASIAEVWKIDPGQGDLYFVTRCKSCPKRYDHDSREQSDLREWIAEVTSVEFPMASRGLPRSLTAFPSRKMSSIAVRLLVDGREVFRTGFLQLRQLAGSSYFATWHEGGQSLRFSRASIALRVEVLARLDDNRQPHRSSTSSSKQDTAESDVVVASSALNIDDARQGFNYVRLFANRTLDDMIGSPGPLDASRSGGRTAPAANPGSEATRLPHPLGQLVLRLRCKELQKKAAPLQLVLHSASGIPDVDQSKVLCAVKWNNTQIGRTRSCPATHGPAWCGAKFLLAPPKDTIRYEPHLVIELWTEDQVGRKADFLGQVVLKAEDLAVKAHTIQTLPLVLEESSKLCSSEQECLHGTLKFSLESSQVFPLVAQDGVASAALSAECEICRASGGLQSRARADGTLKDDGMQTEGDGPSASDGPAGGVSPTIEPRREGHVLPLSLRSPGCGSGDEFRDGPDLSEAECRDTGDVDVASRGRASVEVACEHDGRSSRELGDLLIKVKSLEGVSQGRKSRHEHYVCVIMAGQRELGRTRAQKASNRVVWECSDEPFPLPMELLKSLSRGSAEETVTEVITRDGDVRTASHYEVDESIDDYQKSSEGRQSPMMNGRGCARHTAAHDCPTIDATTMSPGGARHSRSVESEDEACSSAACVTIHVWDTRDGCHTLNRLVGIATIPGLHIERPPGSLSLPLNGPGARVLLPGQNVNGDIRASSLPALPASASRKNSTTWRKSMFQAIRGSKSASKRNPLHKPDARTSGTINLWLGRRQLSTTTKGKPEERRVNLRIHSASDLSKGEAAGRNTKCYISWNGDVIGSTSTVRDTLHPRWDPDTEVFSLILPWDKSNCELHLDLWDMTLGGTRKGDFLGQARVPTAAILHPPRPYGQMSVPLVLRSWGTRLAESKCRTRPLDHVQNDDERQEHSSDTVRHTRQIADLATPTRGAALAPEQQERQCADRVQGAAVGQIKNRLMKGMQNQTTKSNSISGKLTISCETLEDDFIVTGLPEPTVDRPKIYQYEATKFKIAGDAEAERLRRQQEGILVPRMLSTVQALHDRLRGSILTGAQAAGLAGMTNEAPAIIPEILAGQVLSLARRGGHYTVLAAARTDGTDYDRLVVMLRPPLPNSGEEKRDYKRSRQFVGPDLQADDERPKHALVLSCSPGQIGKEDTMLVAAIVTEAEKAISTIERRDARREIIDTCVHNVEQLCRAQAEDTELCAKVVAALRPACDGAGEEIDSDRQDMLAIFALLSPGGYCTCVVASSTARTPENVESIGVDHDSQSSTEASEPVGRRSGPSPMASGIVTRVLSCGDMFLVIEETVYAANVSWQEVRQEEMVRKNTSEDAALEQSVDILRRGIGAGVSRAFVVAPVWASGVGCIGIMTVANVPYARAPQAAGNLRKRSARPAPPFVVHGRLMQSVKRVGLAVGSAIYRTRRARFMASLLQNGQACQDPGNDEKPMWASSKRSWQVSGTRSSCRHDTVRHTDKDLPRPSSPGTAATTRDAPHAPLWGHLQMDSVLPWPCLYEDVCHVYADAIAAVLNVLPWIRAVDIWHISTVSYHRQVFPPAKNVLKDKRSRNDTCGSRCSSDDRSGLDSEGVCNDGCGGRFCERKLGQTWSGRPTIVLRSLRVPGRHEAERAARWRRGNDGLCYGGFEEKLQWTERHLRLLADEWACCANDNITSCSTTEHGYVTDHDDVQCTAKTSLHEAEMKLRPEIRPFAAHTGHVIVPFDDDRRYQEIEFVRHGLVLAVDREVEWRRWEDHLLDVVRAAKMRFRRLRHKEMVV